MTSLYIIVNIFIILLFTGNINGLNCTEETIKCETLQICDILKSKCQNLCEGNNCGIQKSRNIETRKNGNLAWLITPTLFGFAIIFSIYRCYVDGLCKAIKIPLGTPEEIPNAYLPLNHVSTCPRGNDYVVPISSLHDQLAHGHHLTTVISSEPCNGCTRYSPHRTEGILLHNSNSFHILPTNLAPPPYDHTVITVNADATTNGDGLPAYCDIPTAPSRMWSEFDPPGPRGSNGSSECSSCGGDLFTSGPVGAGGKNGRRLRSTRDDNASDSDEQHRGAGDLDAEGHLGGHDLDDDTSTQFEIEIHSDDNYEEEHEYGDTCALLANTDISTRSRHLSAGMPLRSRYYNGSSYRRTCEIDPFARQRHRSEPIYY